MNHTHTSSFGLYESARILVPGFFFSSLLAIFFVAVLSRYVSLPQEPGYVSIIFFFLVLVSGLSMYAKETTKRRRAFLENQPSLFLQNIARRYSENRSFTEDESRQLYFYILNNFIPPAFHEKIFFFGTVYHIMIQIRRTSFWFAILGIVCLAMQTAFGMTMRDQQGLIVFCALVSSLYLLNVKYNKADRKMQENYQDQVFWLQMNEETIKDLFQKPGFLKRGSEL